MAQLIGHWLLARCWCLQRTHILLHQKNNQLYTEKSGRKDSIPWKFIFENFKSKIKAQQEEMDFYDKLLAMKTEMKSRSMSMQTSKR